MPQSVTDTINLIASVVTILTGLASAVGAMARWLGKAPAVTPSRPQPSRAPSGRPSAPPRPAPTRPVPVMPQTAARRAVSHPVILSFSALGLLAVVAYAIELLVNYVISGYSTTGVPLSSPLVGANAVLFVINLACALVVSVAMMITAYRAQSRGWLIMGIVALVVTLLTLTELSVVAFAPGLFYGFSGPNDDLTVGGAGRRA